MLTSKKPRQDTESTIHAITYRDSNDPPSPWSRSLAWQEPRAAAPRLGHPAADAHVASHLRNLDVVQPNSVAHRAEALAADRCPRMVAPFQSRAR